MTERIVDAFEAVDVHEQHGDGGDRRGVCQSRFESIHESAPVEQTGHGVVGGDMSQVLMGGQDAGILVLELVGQVQGTPASTVDNDQPGEGHDSGDSQQNVEHAGVSAPASRALTSFS